MLYSPSLQCCDYAMLYSPCFDNAVTMLLCCTPHLGDEREVQEYSSIEDEEEGGAFKTADNGVCEYTYNTIVTRPIIVIG